jgi:probable DNA repair protein
MAQPLQWRLIIFGRTMTQFTIHTTGQSATRATLLFDAAPLQPALLRGAQLLTPNRRLASRIRSALLGDQTAAPAAPVLALSDWLQQLWQQMLFRGDPLAAQVWVLSAAQELALWEQAIRASELPLLRPAQAAEHAASAYRTLALWRQLPLSGPVRADCLAQPDSAAFIEWLDRFNKLCAQRKCIAIAERDRRVVTAAQAGRLELTDELLGIGFEDIPPLYSDLLALAGTCTHYAPASRLQRAEIVGADTLEQQLQAAALWVREQLGETPAGPFAIVVPDLNQQRAFVERVLLDVLTPEHLLPTQRRQLPPLNFSAGEPLAQMPLLQCALQLLELAAPRIERSTLLQLLRAPFFGIESESPGAESGDQHAALAMFIEALCDLRLSTLRLAQVRQCADAVALRYPGWPLAEMLQRGIEQIRRERWQGGRVSAAVWAERFAQWLALFGWPGTRTLDSIEYQQHQQWQQTLIEFARYDQVLDPIDFQAALQRLRQLLQAQVFQPQTPDAPVQVLGVLEAAGLQFAGVWLCDMSDDRWPAAAAPHPLLPRELQRQLRMPRCDAEREYAIAAQLTQSLLGSASNVVISYQREREEVQRRVSPLLAQFEHIPIEQLLGAELNELLPARLRHKKLISEFTLESFAAGSAPELSASERARGGSALFQNQAACPFRAFARHRLGAYALAEPVAGLDAAERGTILHAALETIWNELKTQEALLALDEPARIAVVNAVAADAIKQFVEQAPHRIGPRFAALEAVRLAQLLLQWLAVESEREPFVVLATEQRRDNTFVDLPLRLRVDRIDQLADGRLLIIDYKTKMANSSVNEWLGERPDEPQLPLYSTLLDSESGNTTIQNVAGIAFAQVRSEQPQLVGIADEALSLSGFKTPAQIGDEVSAKEWPALKTQWREVLESLAQSFIRGDAQVDPKKAQVCTYCDLASVCRIGHQRLEEGADE